MKEVTRIVADSDSIYIVAFNCGKIDSVHRTLVGARKSVAALLSSNIGGIEIKDVEKFLVSLSTSQFEDEEVYMLTCGTRSMKVYIHFDRLMD